MNYNPRLIQLRCLIEKLNKIYISKYVHVLYTHQQFFSKKKNLPTIPYVTDTRLNSITTKTIIIFDFKEDQNKKSIQPAAHSISPILLSPIRPPATLYVWNVRNKLVNFRDSQWHRIRK